MSQSQPPNARMTQNCHLVWLDGSIDKVNSEDCRNSIMNLRQVVNIVNTFTDADECIDFITDIKDEMTLMIISEVFSEIIVPVVQTISQVSAVYIVCENKIQHEKCIQQWSKVKGVYTGITSICEAMRQTAHDCDQNSVTISFLKPSDGASKENLDQLDQSFMYTQILKEILLTIDFDQVHIHEFLTYCREQFVDNTTALKNVDQIEKEYHHHPPIWWYTSDCFLYSMVNRALRMMEIDLIIRMGFFVRDLHKNIAVLHSEQYGGQNHSESFIVYRGQGLSQTDFDELMKTKGGLMSFNNFLSTSLDRAVSFAFADSQQENPHLIGVLFEISVSPSIFTSPFANVKNVGYFLEEEEILFSMHSVFRIGQVKQIGGNTRLCQVDLTLTGDNDPQLHALTNCIQEETFPDKEGWYRLGNLLIKLGQFDKAEQVFDIILGQTTEQREKAGIYHMLGMVKRNQGKYTEAVEFYENSIKIKQNILPPTHSDLAPSYCNIGLVYGNIGEYSKALSYYEKDLEISQKTLPPNHPHLATSYSNIGSVYYNMGKYSKALSYYEKAREIFEKTLPANHPDLATSYNNIGSVYNNMGEDSKALSYYGKALEIRQKTLPANHLDFAQSYNNIGWVYDNMGEHSKALSYYEKALEIFEKTLPENHPSLATSYNNIGLVYSKMGEYSKALSYHEKALEIRQKTLRPNHPLLATSYNNIGLVYDNMGEYSKALSSHEKAFEIYQKTLPENHPHLATSYACHGSVYNKMGEYSKALSYYEKALEIYQKSLPPNHPHLATSYAYHGSVYNKMGEYSKALSYYEKALEIYQKTLSANHPNLVTSYNNIGLVYNNMSEYSKALSSHEKALEIRQKTLPANHPDLAQSYGHIGIVSSNMGEHSKAVLYCEKALKVLEHSLPSNHPRIQLYKNNLEYVKRKL